MDDVLVGTKINRYELLECIDKNDLIGYFKAYDTKLERNVIMKLVLHSVDYSDEAVEYFLNESRALAKLVHPNIVQILDFGFENRNLYLISEYIPGKPLTTLMTGPMVWQDAVEILIPLTDALNYAHTKGVIHRDLKPENITITEDGRLILNDFSLVKIIEDEETRDMTGTKVGLGSPAYISPEQGKGLPADFRSDIYSLGVIFYEMVTGQKPFPHGNSMEIVIQHVTSEPPRPKSIISTLPIPVEKIILTALSKDIGKRYQSMQEFSDALKAVLSGMPQEKTKRSAYLKLGTNRAAFLILILIIVAISGFSIWRLTQVQATVHPAVLPTPVYSISVSTIIPTPDDKSIPSTNLQNSSFPTSEPIAPVQTETTFSPGIAIDSNLSTDRRENTNINTVGFTDNGRLVIAGTSAGLYFYNSSDLTLKYFLDTKGPVSAIATSADGSWIATGDQNGNVAIWNLQDGKEIARFEGQSGVVVSLEISPDKTKLVSASGHTVYLWDIKEESSLFVFQQHAMTVNKVLFSQDGQYFISVGDDFQVMFCNVNNGELVKKYSSTQKINDISISPDGTTISLALNNATIEIRDYKDGQVKKTFQDWKIIDPYIFSKFLPNNSLFATGSKNGVVRIWNIGGNLIWQTPVKDNNNFLKALSVSDDGVKIATVSSDNLITVWDLPTQSIQTSKNLANVPIPSIKVEKSAELSYSLPPIPVISGTEIPKVSTPLEKANLQEITELARWGNPKINAISFIDHSQMILAATSAGVYFYNSTDLAPRYFFEAKGWLSTFTVSQDGNWVATGDKNGNVIVWNIVDGKEVAEFEGQSGEVISLAISSDKTQIAAVSENKIISIWDFNQKQPKFSLKGHDLRVNKILFSPDGQYLISGSDDFQLIFWDMSSGKPTKYPTGQKINDISISPDGAALALALNNHTIEIRNIKDGQPIRKPFFNEKIVDPFKAIKFLPSNSLLVSGSENGISRVWNINGNLIWETPKQDKNGNPVEMNSLKSISISDDGVKVVTLSDDNLINIWDITRKSLLVSKKLDYGPIHRMSISPDNKMVAYQAGVSHVELWSIENHKQIAPLDGSLPRGYPFSSNNEFLVIQTNNTLSLYSIKSETPAFLNTLYAVPPGGTVNYLMDDKIIIAFTNGNLKYWSVSSGKELFPSSPIKYEGICRMFYRDDGQFLAAGSVNGILNEEKNAKYFCHIPRNSRTISEDFLNDGSITALALENQALEVWDLQAGGQKTSIKSQAKGNMFDVAISNDGKLLAAASASGVIEIYDMTTGKSIISFDAHTAPVTQLSFTSDLKYLISGSDDGTIRFWGISK